MIVQTKRVKSAEAAEDHEVLRSGLPVEVPSPLLSKLQRALFEQHKRLNHTTGRGDVREKRSMGSVHVPA